jgi:sugar (pentulose or hexulose) kinase
MILLGLDVGTSSVKAAAFDEDGRELAHGRAPTPWRSVPTGAELDPDALLQAAAAAAVEVLRALPDARIGAVGVAGMAETGALVDDGLRPVVPAIAWHDTRGGEEARRIARELPGFSARTGLPATPLCTLAKYAWMRAHWGEAVARGTRWLNVAEWIVVGLGGEPGAEASLASRTGFYDLHTGAPWDEALAWAGAPPGLAPPHAPAGTPLGRAGGALIDALAPLRGAVLAVAGHDHIAAAIGAGAAGEGDVLDSSGTAEAILRATAPLPPETVARAVEDGFTVCRHALPDRFALLGAVWSGAALQAVLDLLGVPTEEREPLERAALSADPGRLALEGLDEDALTITGLTGGASPAALYRAALERVGAEGAAVLARMAAIAGPARRLVVTGGWSEGVAARAVKERHLGPFEHDTTIFAGARGAALMALRAASRDS